MNIMQTASRCTAQACSGVCHSGSEFTFHRHMRGLSLIELMVALTISMFIMIGLVQIFMSNRVTYQADEGLARLQENARFSMEFLSRELRNAGNLGCLSNFPTIMNKKYADAVTNFYNWPGPPPDLSGGVFGINVSGPTGGSTYTLPALYPTAPTSSVLVSPDAGTINAVTGSDILVTRSMGDDGVPVIWHDGTTIHVAKPNNLKDGQIMVLSNCTDVAVFKAQLAPGGALPYDIVTHPTASGNICDDWYAAPCNKDPNTFKFYSNEAPGGALLGSLRTVVFYVGASANGGPALWRRIFHEGGVATDEELVEGVETMQLLYGFNTDGDLNARTVDQYLLPGDFPPDASGAANWPFVESVRASLLVASSNVRGGEQFQDTSTYWMESHDIGLTPNADHRRRRVFETTVNLRNRHR